MAKKVHTTKDGKRNGNVKRRVVQMRDQGKASWQAIADKLGVSPRTARGIYDEQKGKGAHFASRPLPGGRYRKPQA